MHLFCIRDDSTTDALQLNFPSGIVVVICYYCEGKLLQSLASRSADYKVATLIFAVVSIDPKLRLWRWYPYSRYKSGGKGNEIKYIDSCDRSKPFTTADVFLTYKWTNSITAS